MWEEGQFEAALKQFANSSLNLSTLLSLFPDLELPSSAVDVISDDSPASVALKQQSSARLGRSLDSTPSWSEGSDGTDFVPRVRSLHNGSRGEGPGGADSWRALGALVAYLSRRRPEAVRQAEEPGHENIGNNNDMGTEASKDKEADLRRRAVAYATVLDTALIQALLLLSEGAKAGPLTSGGASGLQRTKSVAASGAASSAAEVAAFRAASDSAVKLGADPVDSDFSHAEKYSSDVLLQLFRAANYCDVGIIAKKLQEGEYWGELLELYKQRKLHTQALGLLRELADSGEEEGADNYGVEAYQLYLKV